MSQFDKDDVEELGLLKLDVLGIRMQSAMAHAVDEVARVDGRDRSTSTPCPRDDPATYELIRSTRTLGCFQIESPGQRELVGKFGPQTFDDLIVDISLFRPGPVEARHGHARSSRPGTAGGTPVVPAPRPGARAARRPTASSSSTSRCSRSSPA